MDMLKHSQSTRNNMFAIASQDLKKEVRDGVHFLHANKYQSFYKLAILFLMEVADIPKVPEIISWEYFCNILKKKYCNGFCVLL